jgi:carbamate kinase
VSRVVAALGGNALQRRGEPLEYEALQGNARAAARALAPLAREHELVVTHGNGPQVGLLALQAAADPEHRPPPFDALDAESEGLIGYVLGLALTNALDGERVVATLLTETVVDPGDPAFAAPSKPIGPVYAVAEGRALAERHGWTVRADGDGVRRVVPSPQPRGIVELDAVRSLLAGGVLPVCAGGGGVPVRRNGRGLAGVEAVVDKDRTSALLAAELEADVLLLLTDVAGIRLGRRTAEERTLGRATPAELAALDLPAGSMGPKAEAAGWFVERTGARAAIGALGDVAGLLAGRSGTQVEPG